MKKHFVFLTFVFSLVNIVTAIITGDLLNVIAWSTAAIASLDHFITLNRNGL